MRLLSDEHYLHWPQFAQRIAFTHNTATHDGIGPITPFEVHHGAPARNTLASALAERPLLSESEELALPAQFAAAVAVSTSAFAQLAKTHDSFTKTETAARLNLKGSTTTFVIGDKVKVRVPPTQAQLMKIGRRAKHVTAWRGPCTVLERLSTTAYVVTDDTTKRRYERVVSNLAPYRATKPKTNSNAQYNQHYSDPFLCGEFIAIRDDVTGPFYVAEVMEVRPANVLLHYYGCTDVILATAVFLPCWHPIDGENIVLSRQLPLLDERCPVRFTPYTGEVDLKDIKAVLVARGLEFTKTGKLRFRALRALTPVHDQLFRFTN
jgi:hypothetical protein